MRFMRGPRPALGLLLSAFLCSFATGAPAATDELAFRPQPDATRDYLVGLRSAMAKRGSDDLADSRALVFTSLLRYRAQGDAAHMLVEPRYMQARLGDTLLFNDGNGALDDASISALMTGGFVLEHRANGGNALFPLARPAWNRVMQGDHGERLAALLDQIVWPSMPLTIAARTGARRTIAAGGSWPATRFTVDRVDDDGIWIDIDADPDGDGPADRRLYGRLRLARDGWIDSLALIREYADVYHDTPVTVHRTLFMQARAHPDRGYGLDTLDALRRRLTNVGAEYELPLPESPRSASRFEPAPSADALFDGARGRFAIEDGTLVLRVDHPHVSHSNIYDLALAGVTFENAAGEPLDIPVLLDSVGPDDRYDGPGARTRVVLRPLGWDAPALDRIAAVKATYAYRRLGARSHESLPLTDAPTHIGDDNAGARAIPVAGRDDLWRIVMTSTARDRYIFDFGRAAPGQTMIFDNAVPDDWLSIVDRAVLARVNAPPRYVSQVWARGDSEAFNIAHNLGAERAVRDTLRLPPAGHD